MNPQKGKVLQMMETLPDDVSWPEVLYKILFLAKVQRGLEQAQRGDTLTFEQVKQKLSKWLR